MESLKIKFTEINGLEVEMDKEVAALFEMEGITLLAIRVVKCG